MLSVGHYRSFPSAVVIYCLCWLYKNVHRVINGSKTQKKIVELWTNPKQTGDNALVQSKGTKTIYINSIRIILKYTAHSWVAKQTEHIENETCDWRKYFNFPIVNFPYTYVATFKQHLHMEYLSLSWSDISELVDPIMISLIAGCC